MQVTRLVAHRLIFIFNYILYLLFCASLYQNIKHFDSTTSALSGELVVELKDPSLRGFPPPSEQPTLIPPSVQHNAPFPLELGM
jgi:hypothetical protein